MTSAPLPVPGRRVVTDSPLQQVTDEGPARRSMWDGLRPAAAAGGRRTAKSSSLSKSYGTQVRKQGFPVTPSLGVYSTAYGHPNLLSNEEDDPVRRGGSMHLPQPPELLNAHLQHRVHQFMYTVMHAHTCEMQHASPTAALPRPPTHGPPRSLKIHLTQVEGWAACL